MHIGIRMRVFLLVLAGVLCLLMLLQSAICSTAGRRAKQGKSLAEERLPEREERFSIVIQAYNRTDVLYRLLNHYMNLPELEEILVVWNNEEMEPPSAALAPFEPFPVPVRLLGQKANSLNNRFRAHEHLSASVEGVLLLDDDILASAEDVSFAFSVWRDFRERIVGFVPRKHVAREGSGRLGYGGFELAPQGAYSMVLTGAAFVRKEYLGEYLRLPGEVHALVDHFRNCEDIAFNMMVGRLTARPPVFVSPRSVRSIEKESSAPYRGLWHRPEHTLERSFCLNELSRLLGGTHLHYSTFKIAPASAACD